MKKLALSLCAIFVLCVIYMKLAYASGTNAPGIESDATIKTVIGALCTAIGVLFRALLKTIEKLNDALSRQVDVLADVSKELKKLNERL